MVPPNTRFVCPICKYSFCVKCNVKHDSTCEEYAKWKNENSNADALTAKLIRQTGIKTCPGCKEAVEKKRRL